MTGQRKLSCERGHQVDEHILESDLVAGDPMVGPRRRPAQRRFECATVLARHVERRAEDGDLLDPGLALQRMAERRQVAADDGPGREPLFGDDLRRRALRHQSSVGDVGELVAALGFVHVVRADED